MSPTKSPAPGVVPQRPGSMDYGSSSSAKVIPLRPNDKGADTGGPFDQLTARLLLAQLPLRLLATALARLGVWMLKPALILYGLYRLAEDCHARRCPGDEAK